MGTPIIPNGHPTWAPLLAASGQQLAVSNGSPTSHEPRITSHYLPTSPAESRVSLSDRILSLHQVTRFGISDSHGFARRKAPSLIMNYVYTTITGGPPFGTAPTNPREPWSDRKPRISHEPLTTNNKKALAFASAFFLNQRLPILPGGLPPSTFGVCGLNCCVRHGNRWIPAAIATELCCSGSRPDNCIKMFFLS